METGELPRLVEQLPAPSKAVSGDVTVGDQCLVLHHPDQKGLLADLRKMAQSVGSERRASEGYESATGDLEPAARTDSVDSCFSSYNSGELADVSRKLAAFGFSPTGVRCSVDCEESLEQRYEAIESCSVADYSESESDSDSESDSEGDEWSLAGGADGGQQPADEVIQALSSLLHRETSHRFESLSVTDSEAVHVGNVTYILGEVNVKQVVQETSLKQQVFVSHDKAGEDPELPPRPLRIVSRNEWLAQPPSQPAVPVKPPLNLILINHTATEASTKMMTNTMLCRRIQLMHMEGNEWWDIGYNFLVGMDGYVYEGRGWGLVGAHTYGYNSRSLGVAFIGCFMQRVPTPQAVAAFHQLVELGVAEGHLTPDCRVVAHCQVSPSESPGRAFFLEMRAWPRWAEAPPPLQDAGRKQPECLVAAPEATNGTSDAEREHTAEEPNTSAGGQNVSDGTSSTLSNGCRLEHPKSVDKSEGAAAEAINGTSDAERECTAEEPNASAGGQDVSDGTLSTLSNGCQLEHPKSVDKSEDRWDGPEDHGTVPCAGSIASTSDEMGTQTVSRQTVAVGLLQQDVGTAESGGYSEQTLTERSSESREAVSVSYSSNVHLGSVNYVLGPLCVSHVAQHSTVERTTTITRRSGDNELCLVQRDEWGAQPTKMEIPPLVKPVSIVIICHTETSCGATLEQEARHVRQLQEYAQHVDELADIRYNFVVGGSGLVFEGRGWRPRSAFACGYDDNSVAVAFLGNFKAQPPGREALQAFHRLMAAGEREGHLAAGWCALGVCQLIVTDSPGRALYQLIQSWPNWAGPSPSETADVQELQVVSREQWLASPPAEPIPKLETPVRVVVICHTETTAPRSARCELRQVRSLQDFEVWCRGRADLAFHFVVAPSGAVYEGRGWALAADLRPGPRLPAEPEVAGGRRCLALALLGDFSRQPPAPAALDALQYLVAEAQRRGVLAHDYHMVGHRQLAATGSPGEALFSLLRTWPRWTDRPFHSGDDSDTAPVR